jgi:hypothetical protein
METMTPEVPLDSAKWSEAYARVENYLRAYRIENRLLLSRLTHRILENSAELVAGGDERPPRTIAINEATRLIREWTERAIGATGETERMRHARARAALYLANIPQRWPKDFLGDEDVPPELREELRSVYLNAGPDLEFSSMTPREIDLGPISDAADETWRTFAKWPLLRGIVTWVVILGLGGVVFYLTRF